MNPFPNIILLFFLLSCTGNSVQQDHNTSGTGILNEDGKIIVSRFNPPETYKRILLDSNSFGYYLRHLPLKPHGEKVHYYDGRTKANSVAAAVIDIGVGDKDLQQCADAVIRLRAEYLRISGREEEIVFNFTNGTPASWENWKNGYRCFVSGNEVEWNKTAEYSDSDNTFDAYLETVFIYAGSLSLEKELIPAGVDDIQAGNVFIQGGSPGHAVIVVDVAINSSGEKVFMLAQSYMPAQDIHILINSNNNDISPWYQLNTNEKLFTPEWVFEANRLKRFR